MPCQQCRYCFSVKKKKMYTQKTILVIILKYLLFLRIDAMLLGHYRLTQDTDNQTKVFAVVTTKKEEVCVAGKISHILTILKARVT